MGKNCSPVDIDVKIIPLYMVPSLLFPVTLIKLIVKRRWWRLLHFAYASIENAAFPHSYGPIGLILIARWLEIRIFSA
jgi:hypothetical protein